MIVKGLTPYRQYISHIYFKYTQWIHGQQMIRFDSEIYAYDLFDSDIDS